MDQILTSVLMHPMLTNVLSGNTYWNTFIQHLFLKSDYSNCPDKVTRWERHIAMA